ncbi:PREDICTED: uncharacterized protein LOC106811132, partial [Priapulus caudatus]|uniref:Uncharacterized protein LOC106811132 n=1 Tax=Priapulus caudatus TaxID=37621 RepID=A0ABM1ED89_PRICU
PSADAGEACDDAAVADMLRGLPQLSAAQAARMHDAVQSACISACRQRSAEHGRDSLTRGQHRAMMSAITMETLRAFLPQLPLTMLHDTLPNEKVSSAAASTDPGDWPERAWLRHREKQRETLERYASEDSLMCAPPPPVQQDVEFDILANLGLFTEEGAGVSDACSPLKLKRRQVTGLLQAKALTWDKRTAEWPDCLDCHSHNVFYNRGRRTEKYEQRIADTALRSVQGETATTQPSLQRPARRTASQRHLSSNAVAISRTKHNRQTHSIHDDWQALLRLYLECSAQAVPVADTDSAIVSVNPRTNIPLVRCELAFNPLVSRVSKMTKQLKHLLDDRLSGDDYSGTI